MQNVWALLCLALAASQAPARWTAPGANIALGKPYTLSPAPNYALCTDGGDATQLTDGVYTDGYFWTQKSTVGWQSGRPIQITLDLGRAEPISGASFSTAAGVAGVAWPASIQVFVSDDARAWWPAGDLAAMSAEQAPAAGYAVHKFRTDRLRCHGRYVAFQVDPGSDYAFCDEIEVYRGPDALLGTPRDGAPTTGLKAAFLLHAVAASVRNQIRNDAERVRQELETARLSAPAHQRLLRELDAATAESAGFVPPKDFRAIVPYCRGHARVFEVRAALWRSRGVKPVAWSANPWDPLDPGDLPPPGALHPAIDTVMLRNEVRGAAVNVANPNGSPMPVQVLLEGFPTGAISVREAVWTGVKNGGAAASALPAAKAERSGWSVRVPSGMTCQVWFSIDSARLSPGVHRGRAILAAGSSRLGIVPISVRVSRATMPARLSLSLGGWDYTDTPTYGVTAQNMAQVIGFLKRYGLDAPWANAAVMPFGKHGPDGRMVEPPDTRPMDRWLDRWRGARTYFVFNSFGEELADTPAARRRVQEWIGFWTRHLVARKIRPSQLGLLLVDEPREQQHDRVIESYARVIRQAQPEVTIFEDPIWLDPRKATPALYEQSTMLCPNRVMWIGARRLFEGVFLAQQQAGKQLAFYSCSGPVRTLDPYSYHRLQAWDCFRYGAVHEGFWAFGDTGGGSAWNEFAAPGTCFCPEFLGPGGCTTSKHMEAIREGRYDYETLLLLKEAAARAEQRGRSAALVLQAKRLLERGPVQVTEARGAGSIQWAAQKDRSLADAVRRQAIALLEQLDH